MSGKTSLFLILPLLILIIGFTSSVHGQVVEPITVSTDKFSYTDGEKIIVTGQVSENLGNYEVTLTVISPNGEVIVLDQMKVDRYNKFQTVLSAGGSHYDEAGSGTYTVRVLYATQNRTDETTFYYISSSPEPDHFPTKTEGTTIIKNTNSYADYIIYDATILEVRVNADRTSLTILIDAQYDGKISIIVPYDVIKMDITENRHTVFVDGQKTNKYGMSSNVGKYHSIDVEFSAGAKKIEIISNDSSTSTSGCELNSFNHPSVVLDSLGFNQITAGETIVFTGRLACENGYKHPNVEITIYENKFGDIDPVLVTTYTDSNGEFSASWIAKTSDSIDSDGTAIQAKYTSLPFESGGYYEPVSGKQVIQIKRLLSEISLDPLPKSAEIGEMLFFTGKLGLESGSPEGYIVYIKDEDPWDADDLLATGYVESDGSYSANWIVTNTDDDRIADVYAVFEGADIYWRTTTCDKGITYQRGGGCDFTIPLKITGEIPPPPPPPPPVPKLDSDGDGIFDDNDQCPNQPETYNGYQDWDGCPDTPPEVPKNIDSDGDGINDNFDSCPYVKETYNGYQDHDGCPDTIPKPIPKEKLSGDEYMRLYHSHSFTKNPVVAIVPAPDSYEEVRKYIIPAQEGVVLWGSDLTREYGGDWNVEFIIIDPSSDKFQTKPDIILNLVTREEISGCGIDFGGYAQISTIRPVNTVVCTSGSYSYSTSQVSSTSSHEFIHAMGLGHAFNKKGDLMCSIEGGKPTCSDVYNRSMIPSDFDLASVAKLYGRDGYKPPNNCSSGFCDDRFTASQYNNFEYSLPPPTPTTPTPTTPTPTTPTPEPKELGIAPFVDPKKDPQNYLDRYNNEPKYKEWFDSNFHEYDSIYEALGLNPEPERKKTIEPKILPPLQQIALGISPQDVTCKDDFQKLYKLNGNPICVSKSSAKKLISRGWP